MVRALSFAVSLALICQTLAVPVGKLHPGVDKSNNGFRKFSIKAKAEHAKVKAITKLEHAAQLQDLNLLGSIIHPTVVDTPIHLAALNTTTASACTSPTERVEWIALTRREQISYIDAVKCLKTKPSVTGIRNSRDLYDDFAAVHILQDVRIHYVAAFLPWHRYFVLAREKALQDCGYTGRTPYWNWVKAADTKNSFNDPIFSNVTGFGGDGNPRHNFTVTSGPFANFTVDLQSDDRSDPIFAPHHLARQFTSDPDDVRRGFFGLANYHDSAAVNFAMASTTFEQFRHNSVGTHDSVHNFIGGDMMLVISPNDPIFFLHHAQVDRLWTLWQLADPTNRTLDYSGNGPGADFFTGANTARLDDMLIFRNLLPDVDVRTVMNTRDSALMCYYYT